MCFLDRIAVFAAEELKPLIDVTQNRYKIFHSHIQFFMLLAVACPWPGSKGAMGHAHRSTWVLEQSAGHVTC